MNVLAPKTLPPEAIAAEWLAACAGALERRDEAAIAALFLPEGHWRDLLAFTWQVETVNGAAAIAARLCGRLATVRPTALRLAPHRTAPRRVTRAGEEVVEAFLAFETEFGSAEGVLRLGASEGGPGGHRAWILLTALQEIRGHGDITHRQRATEKDYSRDFGGANWADKRAAARAYADHDPAAIVVGCGQAGLGIAARLTALGIDTLVIDREERVGDNWRRRYHSLTLHNEVHVNHLPYMPFPPTWPVFIPKDMLANWFEAYVDALELNVWTSTELRSGGWDEAARRWEVTLRRADGTERVMRPRHLVFATGVSGIPVMPRLPGQEAFRGTLMHSGAYTNGAAWKGRHAVVLGTGNSGHDVAQDLHASGAHVTMVQRSPTHIVSVQEAQRVYSIYAEGMPTDDCDLLATAMPFPVLRRAYQQATALSKEIDRPLLERLERRGFRLSDGIDGCGFQMLYLQRGGGYYFNVGCSDLVAEGVIDLLQHDRVERLVPEGLRLKDGSLVPADLIVAATGYENQQEVVRRALGDAIADRIGPVWGFDAGGELRNMWRPTAQPGLWFTAGSLAQCRIYSHYLALQIKAREVGLLA
ncbi:flavin-containing monooxygenase [Paracraurococcus lichenis]|uniref:NAD(P)/FAD-dependent oxidoreductase n=1 Tax=Paracraurococcus lichenis TaxID=3064888 RepID=A0ABT9DVB6_9PROT|nr:NAD(P)/FAD-dependent oxidoreductase [Paracraurococcus sp. LOR1-02]MDO9707823.1 NAD(P)/FAD-dependent oxidoreductase [Paracraurococcus sp. LOR1-02]